MLYPIELLRQDAPNQTGGAKDGVHVNGQATVCHVIHGLFSSRYVSRTTPDKETASLAPRILRIALHAHCCSAVGKLIGIPYRTVRPLENRLFATMLQQ